MVGGKEPAPANYPLISTLKDTGTHINISHTHTPYKTPFFETEPVLEHVHTHTYTKEMSYKARRDSSSL